MAETSETTTIPPYASKKTYDAVLDGWKIGVPGEIDRSLFRTYSGSAQTAMINTLRYLKLIDLNGVPTPLLHKAVAAEGEKAKAIHREIIQGAYGFLFNTSGFQLTTATPRMLEQAFGEAGAQGDTIRKCIAFFILYAKDAEIPLSPHLKKPIIRAARTTTRKRTDNNVKSASTSNPAPPPPPPSSGAKSDADMLLDLLSEEMSVEEQNSVWTLLKYVKRVGR